MDFIIENLPIFFKGTMETLYMSVCSTLFAYVLGLPLGILVVITRKDGLAPLPKFNAILDWVINIGRSIPFLILMVALIPFTQAIVGKSIGPNAAMVSLVIASTPFVARMVEGSLDEIDKGVIEAARTMGATIWEIIYKVYLPEALPSLVRGVSITSIILIGYSAMGGACGAGGLGDIAIRFGYYKYQYDVMLITLVLLMIIVQVIQSLFNNIAKKIDKRLA